MEHAHLDRRTKYSLYAIRTALFSLLKEKELKHITVTDICKLADVNRGTFYKYYDDVPDLFAKIELSVVEETCEIIKEDCLNNFSIEKLISHILHSIKDNQDFVHMLAKNPAETQYIRKIIQEFRPQFMETIAGNSGYTEEFAVNACFDFILGGTVNILLQWIQNGMATSDNQIENMLVQFIHSILNTEM